MSVLAIIQARMSSERFPGKVLMDLLGKPVLEHVIERVRQAKTVDRIVVATAGEGQAAIAGHCEEWGVTCVQTHGITGADVLRRLVIVCGDMEADELVVCIRGNAPLIVPGCIDEAVNMAKSTRADYVGYAVSRGRADTLEGSGYFPEVVQVGVLRRVDMQLEATDPARQEATRGIHSHPDVYVCAWLEAPDWYSIGLCRVPAVVGDRQDLERISEFLEDQDGQQFNPVD